MQNRNAVEGAIEGPGSLTCHESDVGRRRLSDDEAARRSYDAAQDLKWDASEPHETVFSRVPAEVLLFKVTHGKSWIRASQAISDSRDQGGSARIGLVDFDRCSPRFAAMEAPISSSGDGSIRSARWPCSSSGVMGWSVSWLH